MDVIIFDFGSDIKGDSLFVGYENKIEIMFYSYNVVMQVINDVSNLECIFGKFYVGEFIFIKFIDILILIFNEYCCVGKLIVEVIIIIGCNVVEGNGQIMFFIVYILNNVVFFNVSVSGGVGGKLVEILLLNFIKIKWELIVQKDDGIKEGMVVLIWDLVVNQLVK